MLCAKVRYLMDYYLCGRGSVMLHFIHSLWRLYCRRNRDGNFGNYKTLQMHPLLPRWLLDIQGNETRMPSGMIKLQHLSQMGPLLFQAPSACISLHVFTMLITWILANLLCIDFQNILISQKNRGKIHPFSMSELVQIAFNINKTGEGKRRGKGSI